MIDPAPSDGTISDQDRRRLEAALAAALLLIYSGRRDQALADLGAAADTAGLSPAEHDVILAFAQDRARLIQEGVNERMDGSDDPTSTASEIDQYNQATLQPYMVAWATQQGLLSAYQGTPGQDGGTAADDRLWQWTQTLEWDDECQEADALGPASLDDIYGITGGPPPLHPRCGCYLEPA